MDSEQFLAAHELAAQTHPVFARRVTREIKAVPYSQVDIAADAYAPHDACGTNDQGCNSAT
jgi:hypothetical protein